MAEQKPLLSKFQAVLDNMPKIGVTDTANVQGRNSSRQYKYISLNKLIEIVRPIFKAVELNFYQSVNFDAEHAGDKMQVGTVDTYVFDSTDSLKVGSYPFVIVGDAQAVGSQVTYARRYGLSAALGIYPDKDDDGAASRDYAKPFAKPQDDTRRKAAELMDYARKAGYAEDYIHKVFVDVCKRQIHDPSEASLQELDQIQHQLDNQ